MANIGNNAVCTYVQPAESDQLRDLLVLNLQSTTTDEELRAAFMEFGELATCEHKRDKTSDLSRGFGFVRFATLEAQNAALAKGVIKIGENKCEVKLPFGYEKKNITTIATIDPMANRRFEMDTTGQECRIFVGNLPKEIVESEIRYGMTEIVQKLSPKCQVLKVFIPRPFKNYAFVTLDNSKVAAHLIAHRDLLMTFEGRQHKCFAHTAERSVWAGQQTMHNTPVASRLNLPQGYSLVHHSQLQMQQQSGVFNHMQQQGGGWSVQPTNSATGTNSGYAGYNQHM